jgi:hypothetical protein
MEENFPVHVPDGYALVPLAGTRKMTHSHEWAVTVPPYDPQSPVELWWSRVMRWPRRLAVGFLYVTLTWRRSAVLVGVALAVYLIANVYLSRT